MQKSSGRTGWRPSTYLAMALLATVLTYWLRARSADDARPVRPDSSSHHPAVKSSAEQDAAPSENSRTTPDAMKEEDMTGKLPPAAKSDAAGAERAFQDAIGRSDAEALACLLEAIRLDVTQAKFYAAVVDIFARRGDALSALEYLDCWSKIEPDNSLPCALEAWAHLELGDGAAAMKALEDARELGEARTHLLDLYGSIVEKGKSAGWPDSRTLNTMAMSNPSGLSGKLFRIARFLDQQALQENAAGNGAEARKLYSLMSSLGDVTIHADCIMLRVVSLGLRERALKGRLQLWNATSDEASDWQNQLTETSRERERLQTVSKQMLKLYEGDLSLLPAAQLAEYIKLLREQGEVEATKQALLTKNLGDAAPK